MMRAHRLLTTGLVTLGALAGASAFYVAPALAGIGYGYQSQLTGLAGPFGAAFDPSGNVYVADSSAVSVDKFNSSGAPANFSGSAAYISASKLTGTPTGAGGAVVPFRLPTGVAVDASGNIYVTDKFAAVVDVFNAAGVYQRQLTGVTFSEPFGVTVDRSTGDVYVAGGGVVDVFNSADVYQSQFGSGTLGGGSDLSVAVNEATGEAYVADSSTGVVYVFDSSGVLQATWTGGGSGPGSGTPAGSFGGFVFVAVEQSSGHVFVADDTHRVIDLFDTSGTYLTQVSGKRTPSGSFAELYGVAVAAGGDLYAIDGLAGVIDVFAPGATPETPLTEAVDGITGNTAVLHGELNPTVRATSGWYFAYNRGGTCTGGESTPLEAEVEVQAASEEKEVTGLEPSTQYTVCFVAENAFGPAFGAPVTFTTPNAPPLVDAESFSALTPFAATVETEINPNNHQYTVCEVLYGTDATLATHSEIYCEPVLWESVLFGDQFAKARLEGLEMDTTYYYRVAAWSLLTGERTEGAIKSFKTVGPPAPATGQAQSITRVTAALSGAIDPERGAGTYHFAYIDQAGYEAALAKGAENPYAEGATTAEHEVPAGEASQAVQPLLAVGLLPETTYHYALVAKNEAGTVIGNDETFTTGAATPPIVMTGAASAITLSTATISGTLDTQGLNVSYAFEVSTEAGNPGPPSGAGSVGAGPTEASVSVALQGLQPGRTYYYRLLATSTDGTSYGAVQTFTTPGFPSLLVQPATPPLIGTPQVAFPTETGTAGKSTTKSLTNAQKLARALKACKKDKSKSKRVACQKQAHKKYPLAKKKKK